MIGSAKAGSMASKGTGILCIYTVHFFNAGNRNILIGIINKCHNDFHVQQTSFL